MSKIEMRLHYVRTKEGREIDFLVLKQDKPCDLIEVKVADDNPSKHFSHFARFVPDVRKTQLVWHLKREKTYPDGLEIRNVIKWLGEIDYCDI
ncbi:MAG: hypothetical protein GY847_25960 [Proteobacteria bacterium]|nr:hypothetical protein [Pseudomonadota bacterium]